ncbi:TPA: hypothetical protein ACG0ZI_003498, partial [Escherichia coli]|nr:hypothetical protein [Escherichia coli]
RQLAQPVGQTTNTVSGLPAGRAKRVNPPLTVIFKEKRVRKYELFSHFICLFDSEPAEEQQFVKYEFLSSLYGSEPSTSTSFAEYSFLSCLYGSERVRKGFTAPRRFLSCLYGSERVRKGFTAPRRFLSCLYGSELKYYTFSSLLIKQNHLIFLLAPFFILTFQHH